MNTTASPLMQRQRVAVSAENLVQTGPLRPGEPMPLVLQASASINPVEWARNNAPLIEKELAGHGALLFRGFDLDDTASFRSFVSAISPSLIEYRERAAPRKEKITNVYSSTEYPPEYPIPMHHELAYAFEWPLKIWFYCAQPSEHLGATPIADDRVFLAGLDENIRKRFDEKQVMYVRNYGPGLDMPWQEVFQTSSPQEVEAYCRGAGLQYVWRDELRLRTFRTTPALRRHPKTGQLLWFNHAHLFHISNLEPQLREEILRQVDPEDYPRNAYYGDGTPIEAEVLDEIRQTYDRASVRFDWQRGDVLLVDNMAVTHGREPFSGPRSILVAMTEPTSDSN